MELDVVAALTHETGILLARDARSLGLSDELRRAVDAGQLTRLWWGAYVPTDKWRTASRDLRYRLRVEAAHLTRRSPAVLSHWSAAAIWGLPLVGRWPTKVHVLVDTASGGRSNHSIVRHPGRERAAIVMRDGKWVTRAADTVVAMAQVLPFPSAVAMADMAIHAPRRGRPLCTRAQLLEALAAASGHHGYAAAARVVAFANELADSPGESVSRANMHRCGFMLPDLQVMFRDADGLIGFTDFFWRTINRIGEFDGLGKYLREEFAAGRNPAEVVIAEKVREDRLRGTGPAVSRWGWEIANSPHALGKFLSAAGVPLIR